MYIFDEYHWNFETDKQIDLSSKTINKSDVKVSKSTYTAGQLTV